MNIRERQALEGRDPSGLGPDITACEQEPIHIPGSIQPHGLLLVANARTLKVRAAAGDVEARLSPDWLGTSLEHLLGTEIASELAEMPDAGSLDLNRLVVGSDVFDVLAHRSGDDVILEFDPAQSTPALATTILSTLDAAGMSLERATDLRELCERAAVWFRKLTGYDRVMVYQFLDDDAGVVVAEDRDPTLHSFLNHHFPASDIPKQARALYLRNRVRVIPDVAYTPAPLRPASAAVSSLDFSDVGLRSVSPIHIQYLKNMGVGASASISIVKDGVLWGLVACHNAMPKPLPNETRMTCKTLAGALARQIKVKEDAASYQERLRLHTAEDTVVGRLGTEASMSDFFANAGDELCRLLTATSFAAVQGHDVYVAGRSPDRQDVRRVAAWVRKLAAAKPFSTNSLSDQFPEAQDFRDLASGLLAVTMSTEVPTILMWFRAEEVEQLKWAGNPHKAVNVEPGATLTPRTSFEAWREIVRGRSPRWTLNEIETANRLKRTMLESVQNRRIRELNTELNATIAEKESLLEQKDFLMKEVNHRVQNSLTLVSAFLAMQARSANDQSLTNHLNEAQRRLSAVALVHRRLYHDDNIATVDLARYLEELCSEMKATMGEEWDGMISLDLAPMLISTDRAVNVGLILTELVINANKYAYSGGVGPIAISLDQHRNRFRLTVADRGPGKATATRKGFGSRMMKGMVDQLSGDIEETGNDPGLRVVLTAPLHEG